jgi:hypothetical protein
MKVQSWSLFKADMILINQFSVTVTLGILNAVNLPLQDNPSANATDPRSQMLQLDKYSLSNDPVCFNTDDIIRNPRQVILGAVMLSSCNVSLCFNPFDSSLMLWSLQHQSRDSFRRTGLTLRRTCSIAWLPLLLRCDDQYKLSS